MTLQDKVLKKSSRVGNGLNGEKNIANLDDIKSLFLLTSYQIDAINIDYGWENLRAVSKQLQRMGIVSKIQ